METMKLVIPTTEYAEEIWAFRQEFLNAGGSMDGSGSLEKFDNVQDWLAKIEKYKSEETVPEGRVPSTQFLYIREIDGKMVGAINIRHYLSDYLRDFGGHIGYSVRPSERRKGYAARMLHDALLYCQTLGLDQVLVTCLADNEGSRRTILHNGGVYSETVYGPTEKVWFEKYWIEI